MALIFPIVPVGCVGEIPAVPVLPLWIPVMPPLVAPVKGDPAKPGCPEKLRLKEDAGLAHKAAMNIETQAVTSKIVSSLLLAIGHLRP